MTTKTDDEPLPENVSASFKRLAAAAADLNVASDKLGKSIEALDTSIKALGIGVPAWTLMDNGGDPHGSGYFWEHELCYAKVGSKWGIALRVSSGNAHDPENGDVEEWLFSDAPRALRIKAVDHLPALLDKLTEAAQKATENINGKLDRAETFVTAVKAAAAEAKAQGQSSRGKPGVVSVGW